jgi:hypothetical protein
MVLREDRPNVLSANELLVQVDGWIGKRAVKQETTPSSLLLQSTGATLTSVLYTKLCVRFVGRSDGIEQIKEYTVLSILREDPLFAYDL